MENGSIVTKNDARLIRCTECNTPLNILDEYDYYDLNGYFEKECCGRNYRLVQKSYIYYAEDLELDERLQDIELY